MNLRQRRRLETTSQIHDAAVQLARENGVAGITIEAICASAGVSQRTFFNYFPFKEAVFVFPPPPLPAEAVARFLADKGNLLTDLIDLLIAQAQVMKQTPWLGPLMREIHEAYPRLMPLQVAEFQKFETDLQVLIAQKMGYDTEDIRAIALAAAVSSASRSVLHKHRDNNEADLPAIMRETLEALFETIRNA